MKTALVVLIAAVVCVPAFSGDLKLEQKAFTASEAFEAMKALDGTWTGEANVVKEGQPKEEGTKSTTSVTYNVIANDTSIVATYGEGTPTEMVSLFHQDGPDKLIHTHYCAAGNQPSMQFKSSSEPNTITFLFSGGTNMDVTKDGHAHDTTIRIIDENTIESISALWSGGKKYSTRYATMTRQK